MNRILRTLLVLCLCILALNIYSQEPPHPNQGNNPGAGNKTVGSPAPIGNGAFIMMLMAAAYALKSYQSNKPGSKLS